MCHKSWWCSLERSNHYRLCPSGPTRGTPGQSSDTEPERGRILKQCQETSTETLCACSSLEIFCLQGPCTQTITGQYMKCLCSYSSIIILNNTWLFHTDPLTSCLVIPSPRYALLRFTKWKENFLNLYVQCAF